MEGGPQMDAKDEEAMAMHIDAPSTLAKQKKREQGKDKRRETEAQRQPSQVGGRTQPGVGTEEQYPRNSVTQGIFKDDGKLSMYQVDLALEELEENPPWARTIQDVLRVLKGNDISSLEMIRRKVVNGSGTQIPIIGNGHWLLLMIRVCDTGGKRTLQAYVYDSMGAEKQTRRKGAPRQVGMTGELQTAIDGWVKDNKGAMKCQSPEPH
ncbi:hypothetical protein CYMTET_24497 [Cymbomonas tetramitiformis]|uniref:Uncharacterized protein n=1 Tax=Cymbomonas tetramitiformis TaxID=36881 RepID=A0AAE0FWL1_9CHLO|nr:hypothetical protein CYMTET_24497 [Cymbomonas tetramitiformis]